MDSIVSPSVVNAINVMLITLLPLFILFVIYAKYKLSYWKRQGVKQIPNSDLVFGDFKDAILFRTGPGSHLGNIYRAAKEDAPLVGFYIFHKPCIMLRDLTIMKQILVKDFENFSDRHFAGRPQKDSIGMRNLFGVKNPAWKYLRSKITPALTPGKLKQMFPFMTDVGKNMMDYLKDQKSEEDGSKIVDGQEINYKFASDLIASVGLGTPMDSFNHPDTDFAKCIFEFFHGFRRMVALVLVFFIPELVEKIGSTILFDSKFVGKVFWNSIEEREKSGSKRGDFIDYLLKLKNGEQNPIYKFEGENLMFQSGTFFAGFESSATTAAFTLMELARNMEYQEQARKDVLTAIDEYGWGYEAMNHMKYLDQCIAEGGRLHPPVSTIDRITKEDYQVPGTNITLKQGTPIYISLYGLQRDPRFFEDPDVYNPDRFQEGHQISEAYMPFGIGPRMCIGMKLGQLHVKVVLSLILKDYEIYQNPKNESILDPRSTFTAAINGIMLHFRKIET